MQYRAAQQRVREPNNNKVKPGHIKIVRSYEHVLSLGIEVKRVALNVAKLKYIILFSYPSVFL